MGISWMKRLTSVIRKDLKLQLLASLLLCLGIAFGSFLIFHFSIRAYLLRQGDRKTAESKLMALEQDFQALVSRDGLSSTDMEALEGWASKRRTSVFVGGQAEPEALVFGLGPYGPVLSLSSVIRYQDGDLVTRFVYTPLHSLRFISWVVGLLLAFDVFLISLFLILKEKLNYILKIERGIGILESGNLEHEIPVEGSDELTHLASSVNLLSRSIRDRVSSEQKALQANRQIIGDLSHDIRTPLTVAMGYLTLLLEKDGLGERERREYLALALKKAEQIKERTRALLEFATLTSGQLPVRKTVVDVRTMVEQLKAELSALGELRVTDEIPAGTTISGDDTLLERLFDNLLSNLQKYGDASKPLSFCAGLKDGYVQIEMENEISENVNEKYEKTVAKNGSSLSLGLKICAGILELHGGSFETIMDENTFRVIILIPAREI